MVVLSLFVVVLQLCSCFVSLCGRFVSLCSCLASLWLFGVSLRLFGVSVCLLLLQESIWLKEMFTFVSEHLDPVVCGPAPTGQSANQLLECGYLRPGETTVYTCVNVFIVSETVCVTFSVLLHEQEHT